eukprot:3210497-Pleurochrysis_carterae.AAC.1
MALRNERPDLPDYCHPKMKHLIQQCWSANSEDRPSFTQVRTATSVRITHLFMGVLLAAACCCPLRAHARPSPAAFTSDGKG